MQKLLQQAGIADLDTYFAQVEESNYRSMLHPNLEQMAKSQGPLALVMLYRTLVRNKTQGDTLHILGIRQQTAVAKVKEFCQKLKIDISPILQEIARQEVGMLITQAKKEKNPHLCIKKTIAQLKIIEQQGIDLELDGNAGIKSQIQLLEQSLSRIPAN
jgi:hypothetical protein